VDSTSTVFFLEIAQKHGLNERDLILLIGAVVLAVNWIKAEWSVTGKKLYFYVLGVSLVFAAASWLPDIGKALAGGLIGGVGSILGWGTLKIFRPNGNGTG